MSARSRRTRFAASLVVVVAGASGCKRSSGGGTTDTAAPRSTWYVHQGNDGSCWAVPHVECSHEPGGHTCNPPAGLRIACPSPMQSNGATIVTYDGSHCTFTDGAPVACPGTEEASPPPPAPVDAAGISEPGDAGNAAFEPRRWQITQGNKVCYAELTTLRCPAGATCNPPGPKKVSCPPYEAGAAVIEVSPGACRTTLVGGGGNCPPGLRCNPPPPREVDVPCPR